MKNIGVCGCGYYEYHDIKDYEKCCTCLHFSDNCKEERFECLSENRDLDDCYEPKE